MGVVDRASESELTCAATLRAGSAKEVFRRVLLRQERFESLAKVGVGAARVGEERRTPRRILREG